MKFSINKEQFLKKLLIVNKAISGKALVPILSGIKISVSKNHLVLIGSNSEISIRTTLISNKNNSLKIQEEGSIVVKANFFINVVRRLSEKLIDIRSDNSQIKIDSGKTHLNISGQSAENYPQLPQLSGTNKVSLSAKQFIDLIDQTIKSVSVQDTRPLLTGIRFVIKNNQIKAVSTDSHRLSQRIIDLPEKDNEKGDNSDDVVVPSRALVELKSLIGNNENIELQFDESQLLVNLNETIFYSRLLEGKYPETDRLIPKEISTSFKIDSSVLNASLNRASLVAHQASNLVAKFSITNGKLIISTGENEIGNVYEELVIKDFKGKDLNISFNPDFVRDAISSIDEEELHFFFTESLRPFVIRPGNSDVSDNHKLQLITPVRTF